MCLYINDVTHPHLFKRQMFLSQVKLFLILLSIISLSEQTLEKQAENLRSIYNRYELDKKKWAEAIISLQEKVKVNDKKRCLKLLYFFFSHFSGTH
jgi:hypothetical protein